MRYLMGETILALCVLLHQGSVHAEPVVIAHPQNPAKPDLAELKRLFLGKDKTLGGSTPSVALDVDEKSDLRKVFLEKVVDKSETELRQYWSRLVFTGKGIPPRSIGDDAAVREFVATNKDAVGIIDSSHLDPSVKVLLSIE